MLRREERNSSTWLRLPAITFAIALTLTGSALADDDGDSDSENRGTCSKTAAFQFDACGNEVRADHLLARAICINFEDEDEREECLDEAAEARSEDRELCREQRDARRDLCDVIGEDAYDPDFDPADFDDDFTDLTNPNPYRPLTIGNVWEYESEEETVTVTVLDETKLIDGVTCIVVNDIVAEEGEVIEDTDDWFAQHVDGTVFYCGEIATDFETFEDDMPALPELVSIDGSFKAGRDGDKAGILFPGAPAVGDTYRQEWSASNAEDVATVLSTTYSFGDDPDFDEFAPQDLVDLLCAGDCVVTAEFTPLDPGELEYKYYAPGIGMFLEVKPEDGEVAQLVSCNFDPRCDLLPAP